MIERHSTIAHAAYHDLVRSLKDDAVAELRGTPTRVERNGKVYWYDTYRVGSDVRKAYIGEETGELLDRLARISAIRAALQARREHRVRLIRILRAEGFTGVDAATGSLLAAMASAGVFRLGGTIVGTHAYRLYEGLLGVRLPFDQMAQTGDIDIASFERLSLALEDTVSPRLQDVLSDFAFAPVASLDRENVWRWRQTRGDLLVEFLTPSFDDEEKIRPLAALGVSAQSLHHLNYLLRDSVDAALTYRSGVLVRIPAPERFAVHKLIVADRRHAAVDAIKAVKDRAQAAWLIAVLAEDRPEELRQALEEARKIGPRWRERIAGSLRLMPDVAAKLTAL